MPRRKIGADLKEALCKLYEAGDISADTIEKHGIMSRATFFRNLKMYKTGASLEQRYSTGRKTNADKLKQQERQQLDALQPAHLSHLELVMLLDDADKSAQASTALRKKRRGKEAAGGYRKKEASKVSNIDDPTHDPTPAGEDSASESDVDVDERSSLANQQALDRMVRAARSFISTSNGGSSADIDSLANPDDSHYSHSNRGALFVVRCRGDNESRDGDASIVAAAALRSLIWTPEIYQALGRSYANRSIDKICNLAQLHVDPAWRRKGIGRWLVRVAELKASKLGFSQLYTQCDTDKIELLSFWRATGLNEFTRLNHVARLEKAIFSAAAASSSPRLAHSLSVTARMERGDQEPSSRSNSKKRRIDTTDLRDGYQPDSNRRPDIPQGFQIDPHIPLDPSLSLSSPSRTSVQAAAAATVGALNDVAFPASSKPAYPALPAALGVDPSTFSAQLDS